MDGDRDGNEKRYAKLRYDKWYSYASNKRKRSWVGRDGGKGKMAGMMGEGDLQLETKNSYSICLSQVS